MNNSWNLEKLKKQAIGNQIFDDQILNLSGILEYQNLKLSSGTFIIIIPLSVSIFVNFFKTSCGFSRCCKT